jgi:hypothetical protein
MDYSYQRKNPLLRILFVIIMAAVICCSKENNHKLTKEIVSLESQIDSLKLALKIHEIVTKPDESIVLDVSAPKTYQKLNSTTGTFLVSLLDIQPYLDWYKLIINIGNPSSADYRGLKCHVKWGPAWNDKIDSYESWTSKIKEKDISFAEELTSGYWNKINLVLSPATSNDLGYVELSITTDAVRLLVAQ